MSPRNTALLALAISLLIACHRGTFRLPASGGAPVARLQVEPATLSLAYPQTSPLDLTWLPQSPLRVSADHLVVFVHLIDHQGKVVKTFDHPFPGSWTVGKEITYPLELYQSAIDPPMPAATYSLTVGLCETSGRRWPLQAGGPEVDDNEYALARVEVQDASRSTPKLSFSGSWLRPEATGNRQTLAHRWLGHPDGRLVIWGIERPGEAVLTFKVPELPAASSTESEPAVGIRSKCADVRGRVSGYGTHEVRLAVTPAATGDSCTVSFAPNFFFRASREVEKRSALLEKASWTSSG